MGIGVREAMEENAGGSLKTKVFWLVESIEKKKKGTIKPKKKSQRINTRKNKNKPKCKDKQIKNTTFRRSFKKSFVERVFIMLTSAKVLCDGLMTSILFAFCCRFFFAFC